MKTRIILTGFIAMAVIPIPAKQEPSMNNTQTLEELKTDLISPCKYEIDPPLSPDTQKLYNYALYHDLHNMWKGKKGDDVWQNTAIYYRIAAANGDYKANVRLQYLLRTGRVQTKNAKDEVIKLNDMLMKSLPGLAHYNIYYYLNQGYAIKSSKGGAFAYLRKAAELGNKEAQHEIAEILDGMQDKQTFDLRKKIKMQLFSCASKQGLGEASTALGIILKLDQDHFAAVKAFHQGTKNGNKLSALALTYALEKNVTMDSRYYLALKPDAERHIRYKMIQDYLSTNDYLQPKVPDLDQIVPLPPAKLPAWDGKIEFQRWYEGASPPKPSDELMKKLAEQAGLDWQTGLPLKK